MEGRWSNVGPCGSAEAGRCLPSAYTLGDSRGVIAHANVNAVVDRKIAREGYTISDAYYAGTAGKKLNELTARTFSLTLRPLRAWVSDRGVVLVIVVIA